MATRLPSHLVPQANDPQRLIGLARHLAAHGADTLPDDFRDARDLAYYRSALRILGWADHNDIPTQAASALLGEDLKLRLTFLAALEASELGRAWLSHSGAATLGEVDADGIEDMLEAITDLSASTRARRASTLRRWLSWCAGESSVRTQQDLFGRRERASEPARAWPDPTRFPHNETSPRVGPVVEADLARAGEALIVVGYASLDRIIHLLAARDYGDGAALRVLVGNEPFASRRDLARLPSDRLSDEVRDYWLSRGISVLQAGEVVTARDALLRHPVEIRTAPTDRAIHAKIYCTSAALTLGSSNFTANGMGLQAEANARFAPDDERYHEARELAEGLWDLGIDYREGLLALLDQLVRAVTWQEALARAAAEVLEGAWARRYVPADEIDILEPPLWPHQLQGISQAIWALHNRGSVLVADATGSGKTRMGAWLLRAAFDRQVRAGQGRRVQPVIVAPPPIVRAWREGLNECGLRWEVDSHGPLSNTSSEAHERLVRAIAETELLAVDEAHNFLNSSHRTHRLRTHYADNAVLFTATPINRGAADLLSLVELLGPDNFPDTALETLQKLMRLRRGGAVGGEETDREEIRQQIRAFMVRRTRRELNRIVDERPDAYQMQGRRAARYPHHQAAYYDLPSSDADLRAAAQIVALADQLKGVARLGTRLALPRALAIDGVTEEDYLRRVVRSVGALARHMVMDCLRSSRLALFEHIHGTAAAITALAPELGASVKTPTGDTLATLAGCAGHPPEWGFADALREAAPRWVYDPDAHQVACEEDIEIYRQIADLVAGMSDAREQAKLDHLSALHARWGLVIAYDAHLLSLALFESRLRAKRLPVSFFSGEGGAGAKRKAMAQLGLRSGTDQMIALCTDAFSEGMNLQKASVVVHLDTPTVIRTAEQRAGRVDRMDSPHDQVEIWWPRDPPGFAPRKKDLLRERHEVVSDLIGANLQMPDQDGSEALSAEELAGAADLEREDPRGLYDAFRPVRALIEEGGLVGPTIYQRMRTSQAEIVAAVSLVRSARPWGFFAVGGLDRIAPRWVYLDGPEARPVLDLEVISEQLRAHLGPQTEAHPLDDAAGAVIEAFIARLRQSERELLPERRQRALRLADRVLPEWTKAAFQRGDMPRVRLLQRIQRLLATPPEEQEHPDARGVADAWLHLIRPTQRRAKEEASRRRRLWKLDDLYAPLIEAPVETALLERAFARIPMLVPVSGRVVAMIVGVPGS